MKVDTFKKDGMLKTIKDKLAYNWKQMFRHFSSKDTMGSGIVSFKSFHEELSATGTFLSKEEL